MRKDVGFVHKDGEIEQKTFIFIGFLKEIQGQSLFFLSKYIYFYFAVAIFSLCAFTPHITHT